MKIDNDVKLDYSDVLLVPERGTISSRSDVSTTIKCFDKEITPIIAANMDGVGTIEMAEALSKHKVLTALTKHYTLPELLDFYTSDEYANVAPYTIYSMGMSLEDRKKFVEFHEELETATHGGLNFFEPFAVCIDVANGYTKQFEDFISEFSVTWPSYVLIAGNVVTPDQTDRLIECGADIVKIGIGPGSVCTTRSQTGVGYPQLSAVLECSDAARDAGGLIIADGGCTGPGDLVKAYAAGADFVMLGGMLAGTEECGFNMVTNVKKIKVPFYGMASRKAQELHNGGLADYRSSEGKEVSVDFKGPVDNVIKDILGGVRSGCTYLGADSITQLHRKGKFIRVNRQLNDVFGK